MRFQSNYRGRPPPFRASYGTTSRGGRRNFQPASAPKPNQTARSFPLYCRLCHLTGQPAEMVRSHRLGDLNCPKISATDKQLIEAGRNQPRVNAIHPPELDQTDELADILGYGNQDQDDLPSVEQVSPSSAPLQNPYQTLPNLTNTTNVPYMSRTTTVPSMNNAATTRAPPRCNFIKPVPSQILTVFTQDQHPVHIELDSNATVNYIRLDTAKSLNFHISPSPQASNQKSTSSKSLNTHFSSPLTAAQSRMLSTSSKRANSVPVPE